MLLVSKDNEILRIFLVLAPSSNLSVPGSATWLHNLYEPLCEGHDVFLMRIDEATKMLKANYGNADFREFFSDLLLRNFDQEHTKSGFDLFLSYFQDQHIFPAVIEQIKKWGVPTANFSCNNTHQFYLTQELAPHYDFNLHSEKSAGEKFRRIGANPIWFQMAANPKYYHRMKCQTKYQVSFVGANYALRGDYVYHLLENDISVHCFGPNWLINKPHPGLKKIYKEYKRITGLCRSLLIFNHERRFAMSAEIANYDFQCYLRTKYQQNLHYPVSDDDMVKLYSQSNINLGFLEVYANDNAGHTCTQQHLHLREFEVPMSGGLYFTNYSEELAEHYLPDKEVVVFRNKYELLDKINYYLSRPKEAEMVRQAGNARALMCHTYQKRFQDLFKKIF